MDDNPEKIGKYEIIASLGEGAMGVVYEGFDPDIQRRVAIKTLHPLLTRKKNGQEFLERFKREAQSAARCIHPNVVTVLEYGQDGDMPYIVMEFVEGASLQDILKKRKPISLQKTLSIVSQYTGSRECSVSLMILSIAAGSSSISMPTISLCGTMTSSTVTFSRSRILMSICW